MFSNGNSRFSTSGTQLPRKTHNKPPKTLIKRGYPPRACERSGRARATPSPVPPFPRPLPPAPLAHPAGGSPHAGAGVAIALRGRGARPTPTVGAQIPRPLRATANPRPCSTGDSGRGQGYAPPPHYLSATAQEDDGGARARVLPAAHRSPCAPLWLVHRPVGCAPSATALVAAGVAAPPISARLVVPVARSPRSYVLALALVQQSRAYGSIAAIWLSSLFPAPRGCPCRAPAAGATAAPEGTPLRGSRYARHSGSRLRRRCFSATALLCAPRSAGFPVRPYGARVFPRSPRFDCPPNGDLCARAHALALPPLRAQKCALTRPPPVK
jgi:hypothetical protein